MSPAGIIRSGRPRCGSWNVSARARSRRAAVPEVLQEILYRYAGLRRLDLAREVYDLFVALCPVMLPVTLADTDRARDLIDSAGGISVRDAVHAAVMLNNGVEEIASFDTGFDLVPGIRRVVLS